MDDEEREAQNWRRHRQLMQQVRRALLTLASGIDQWLADDPDKAPPPEVIAGDSRTMRHTGNKPPHQFHNPEPTDDPAFRANDRLMRQAPDPNGRFDRR
jgi:hypothetical protein